MTPKPKHSGGEYGTRRGRCVVEKGCKNGEGLGMGGSTHCMQTKGSPVALPSAPSPAPGDVSPPSAPGTHRPSSSPLLGRPPGFFWIQKKWNTPCSRSPSRV